MIIVSQTRKWKYIYRLGMALILYALCVVDLQYTDLIGGTLLSTCNGLYKSIFGTIAWSFPQGLIFFIIGFDFMQLKGQNKLNISVILFTLVSITVYYCEIFLGYIFLGNYSSKGLIILPFITFALLQLCISSCRETLYVYEGKILRNISTLLYLSHPILMAIGRKLWGLRGFLEFSFVLLSFSLMCIIYFRLVEKEKFKWLKYAC